jgi:hypothetical protein
MFCAPDEGAAAVIMCRADIAHKFTDKPVYVRASEIRTRTFGAYGARHLRSPGRGRLADGVRRQGRLRGRRHGPEDVDIAQLQDTDAGAEVIHMAETGLCADGDQEKMLLDGDTEITAGSRSTPTVG